MKQHTAVEWLMRQSFGEDFRMKVSDYQLDLFQQALEMEKKQIKNAIILNQNGLLRRKTVLEAEQYYNETYGK